MVSILLQLVGLACIAAFLYLLWPPSLLGALGLVLVFGVEMADR